MADEVRLFTCAKVEQRKGAFMKVPTKKVRAFYTCAPFSTFCSSKKPAVMSVQRGRLPRGQDLASNSLKNKQESAIYMALQRIQREGCKEIACCREGLGGIRVAFMRRHPCVGIVASDLRSMFAWGDLRPHPRRERGGHRRWYAGRTAGRCGRGAT